MASLFTKIINGEIPCHKILEDEHHLSFLDIRPIAKGHALAIPKKEVDYIFDLSDEEMADLMAFAKKAAQKIEAKVSCKRIGIMVAGLEVPHCHIHLVPIQNVQDLNFSNAKDADPQELKALAEDISS